MCCKPFRPTRRRWSFIPALITFALLACYKPAWGATIQWEANQETNFAGYKVYIGTQTRRYDTVIDAGRTPGKTIESLLPGRSYYLAVTAYCSNGLESDFSAEVILTLPALGTNTYLVPFRLSFPAAAAAATITFVGEAGRPCFIQACADMRSWQTIGVFTPPSSGTYQWADAEAPRHAMRIYRVIGSRP